VIPLNEEKGRAECRRLVGKNGEMQNLSGAFNTVSPRKQ